MFNVVFVLVSCDVFQAPLMLGTHGGRPVPAHPPPPLRAPRACAAAALSLRSTEDVPEHSVTPLEVGAIFFFIDLYIQHVCFFFPLR